jgi:hypothetical protein
VAAMLAVNAEVQGMIALNQYRLARGETIAYDVQAFYEKGQELHALSMAINAIYR